MSSFLYWTNNWVDTNATWVLAKSMFFEHKVLYKDIYDQRGIILYIIYGVGSIISAILATKTSFIGLFILEYAVGIVNLIFSKKIIDLLGIKHKYLAMVLAVFIFTEINQGGSPEEFMTPFVMMLLYLVLKIIYDTHVLNTRDYYLQGLVLGLVFWTKFSFIGFWLGFFLIVGLNLILKKDFGELIKAVGYSLIGFFTLTIPVLFYFLIHNSLGELWFGYWKLNTQYYHPHTALLNTIINIPNNFIVDWTETPQRMLYLLLMIFGCVFFSRKNKYLLFTTVCLGVSGVYFGSTLSGYYYFIFHAFIWLGCLGVLKCAENKFNLENSTKILIVGALIFIFSLRGTPVLQAEIQRDKNIVALVQSHKPNNHPTLLQYEGLGTRFYNLLNITPNVKYFLQTNINKEQFPEMPIERIQYIYEKKTDFIIFGTNPAYTSFYDDLPKTNLTKKVPQTYVDTHGNERTVSVPKVLSDNYHLIGNEKGYLIYLKN